MKTLTIDIPDNKIGEVLAYLNQAGIEICESEVFKNNLSKVDYEKHFKSSERNRKRIQKLKMKPNIYLVVLLMLQGY